VAAAEAGAQGRHRAGELRKLHEHLLAPMGVTCAPASLGEAVTAYRTAREKCERRLGDAREQLLMTKPFGWG
jgi:hypothetical protein